MEGADDPEKPFHITAGDVILADEGTVHKVSTPSKARGESSSNSSFSDNSLFVKPLSFCYCLHSGTFGSSGLTDQVTCGAKKSLIILGVLDYAIASFVSSFSSCIL